MHLLETDLALLRYPPGTLTGGWASLRTGSHSRAFPRHGLYGGQIPVSQSTPEKKALEIRAVPSLPDRQRVARENKGVRPLAVLTLTPTIRLNPLQRAREAVRAAGQARLGCPRTRVPAKLCWELLEEMIISRVCEGWYFENSCAHFSEELKVIYDIR